MDRLTLWKLFILHNRNEWQLMTSCEGREMAPDISINADNVQTGAIKRLTRVFRLLWTKLHVSYLI